MEGNEEGMNIIIIFSRIRWGVKADGNNSCGVFVRGMGVYLIGLRMVSVVACFLSLLLLVQRQLHGINDVFLFFNEW